MRIALADDHALFRAGLRSTLIETFGTSVEVSEAGDFDELTALLASERKFDLILCDLRMPGMVPGSLRDLASRRPDTPLVVVSASEEPADACDSLEQGARGYILKSESLAVLHHAIELVLAGGVYAPVSMLLRRQRPANDGPPAAKAAPDVPPDGPLPKLSGRQWMIFQRLANGMPNKLIARELGIAEGTVKAQVRGIFRKLGVRNRTQAALFAAEILGRGGADDRVPAAAGERRFSTDLAAVAPKPLSFQPAKAASLKIVTSRD